MVPDDTIVQLREALQRMKAWPETSSIIEERDTVIGTYQPLFSPDRVKSITEDQFRSFLSFRNNRHWKALNRRSYDVGHLREALTVLLDESKPVDDRLNKVFGMKIGINRAIATPILLISQPQRYGVWNKVSEAGMKRLKMWPNWERGESEGSKYLKINDILREVRDELGTDFWSLDAVWWYMENDNADGPQLSRPTAACTNTTSRDELEQMSLDGSLLKNYQGFGLERHLHDFLRDNWKQIDQDATGTFTPIQAMMRLDTSFRPMWVELISWPDIARKLAGSLSS